MNYPDIFISHSSEDASIADALVRMLEEALPPASVTIRCTSCEGHGLEIGDQSDDVLRDELIHSKVLIGIMTDVSLKSTYVLFELGARWGQIKKIYPMLAAGAIPEMLPLVIRPTHALLCDRDWDLRELVRKVGEELSLTLNDISSYEQARAKVIASSTQAKDRHFYIVPLTAILNKDLSTVLRAYPTTEFQVGNIKFQLDPTGRFFDTANLGKSASPSPLRFPTPLANVRSVYVLVGAGNGLSQYRGRPMGKIGLKFNHATQWTSLVLGENIREWTRPNPSGLITQTQGVVTNASELGRFLIDGWNDLTPTNDSGGFDRLEIPVSQPFRNDKLTQITLERINDLDAGFFVVAMTVEHSSGQKSK